MEQSISNTTPKSIMDACFELGIDSKKILSQAGINKKDLLKTNDRTPFSKVVKMWEESEKEAKIDGFGLYASNFLRFGAVKVIDYLFLASSTSKESIEKLLHFYPLINSVFSLNLEAKEDLVYLKLENPNDDKFLPPQYVNYVLACVLGRIKYASAGKCNPYEIQFTASKPASLKLYHQTFQSKIKFKQDFNQIIFKKEMLNIIQPNSDPKLCEMLDEYAQNLLKKHTVEKDLLYELRKILRTSIPQGRYALDNSAKQLGMSRRSVQRKLKQKGYSYQKLLDQIRFEIAQHLLNQKQTSIEEIGYLVGYSEKSSFYRAFNNWTGMTPLEFLQKKENVAFGEQVGTNCH